MRSGLSIPSPCSASAPYQPSSSGTRICRRWKCLWRKRSWRIGTGNSRMPALRELQRRFAMALLDGDAEAVAPFIRGAGLEPARRVAIYRNNCRETFLATLAAAYPVLKQLVGDDYFRQLVREYQERYPSRSGNLQHLGAALAGFLDRRFARTPFDYFTDVA